MKTPSTPFTPDQPLRAALAHHQDAKAKGESARIDALCRRRERQQIIEQQVKAGAADLKQVQKLAELEMLAGVADGMAVQQLEIAAAALPQINSLTGQLCHVYSQASDKAKHALRQELRGRLAPYHQDTHDLDRAANFALDNSGPWFALSFHDHRSSISSPEGEEVNTANRVLGKCVAFVAALKEHAALLGADFNPFPATLEQMNAEVPLKVAAPPVEMVEVRRIVQFRQVNGEVIRRQDGTARVPVGSAEAEAGEVVKVLTQ